MRVAVVGGGPSGLATLKYLVTAHEFIPGMKPIEAKLFEAEAEIGGTFRYRTYEEGELVSSKFLTCYSDFRPRPDEPQFMSVDRYLEYLEQYCTRFDLWPHILLSSPVLSIRRKAQGHIVRYKTGDNGEEEWTCDAVAICSGLHVIPALPDIPGLDTVSTVMHSSDFKTCEQFGKAKTVVILGVGETSMDISYMAVRSPTKRVVVCHRGGWINAPKLLPETDFLPWLSSKPPQRDPYKDSPGIPIDCAHSSLFDTAYVHPIVRDSMIPWNFHHYVFTGAVPWLMTGTWLVWDQWVGKRRDPDHHISKVLFNKSNKALFYINAPFSRAGTGSLAERIRSLFFRTPTPDLHGRVIDLTSWPTHVDDAGIMHFVDDGSPERQRMKNEVIKPDVVILATGYRQEFPFFAEQDVKAQEASNRARSDGKLPTSEDQAYGRPSTAEVRRIWAPDDPTVAFIGFVRPQIGAIPSISEMQAMLWVLTMVERLEPATRIPSLAGKRLPKLHARDQWHYMLQRGAGDRIEYGVDHDSYVYQLACDMDCAPSLAELLAVSWRRGWRRGWNIVPTWAFVSQVNTKFRIRGPWKWDGAAEVIHGELWTLVERNGGFVGAVLQTGLPFMVFGVLNLVCWVYAGLLGLFGMRAAGPYAPTDRLLS